MTTAEKIEVKVADEAWIAAALLHREHPEREDFTIREILERAKREGIDMDERNELRKGVYVHIVQHCVANRPPNPGRYRMLFETTDDRRRLFRKGDSFDSKRDGAKITPREDEIPEVYRPLLRWYEEWSSGQTASDEDPLMAIAGTGAHYFTEETPDEYVRRMREGWE